MQKITIFNDWRNSYISFPITNVISFNSDGRPYIINYNPNLFGNFGGAILGYDYSLGLGITGKENFIKLNSILDAGYMFFYNQSWIDQRATSLSINNYNFVREFNQVFDIYKLQVGIIDDQEYGLIKIVDKNAEGNVLFTTYNKRVEH